MPSTPQQTTVFLSVLFYDNLLDQRWHTALLRPSGKFVPFNPKNNNRKAAIWRLKYHFLFYLSSHSFFFFYRRESGGIARGFGEVGGLSSDNWLIGTEPPLLDRFSGLINWLIDLYQRRLSGFNFSRYQCRYGSVAVSA